MSHSIFTRKFKATGDEYSRIIDLPTFGHSDNHAGIQIVDLICSSILFPVAAWTYSRGHIQSTHIRVGYDQVKSTYMPAVQALQHRYQEANGNWQGGLTVSDAIAQRSTKLLFNLPAPQPSALELAQVLPFFSVCPRGS